MGKAEREGWNTWNRYLEAGVVEETLLWTDDPILVDNTLGRIQDKLRKCWPIDAAVAYTLANHGEQAQLTWKDMVNQNTRIATVMMTGKVGYGTLTNPLMESCGHDEVHTTEYELPLPCLLNGNIAWQSGVISDWEYYDDAPDVVKKACVFRCDGDFASVTSKKNFTAYLMREECKPLLLYLAEKFGTDKFNVFNEYVSDDYAHLSLRTFEYEDTKGECGYTRDDANYGSCAHHNDVTKEDWYMIREEKDSDEMDTIWYRGKGRVVHSGWNHDQFMRRNITNKNTEVSRIIPFNRVKRSLAQSVPDEVVINEIKGSIQRMRNWDGRRLVNKTGIGRRALHGWSDWSWLTEVSSWIQDTRSKNRNENDTACSVCYVAGETEDDTDKTICRCGDGWRYTKYEKKESYGHEIAKFQWTPITPQEVYVFLGYNNWEVPYLFKNIEQTMQLRDFIPQLVDKMPTGSVAKHRRTWDLTTGSEILTDVDKRDIGFRIVRRDVILSMKWDKDPENLPTAVQMKDMLLFGNPSELNEAIDIVKEGYVKRRSGANYSDEHAKVIRPQNMKIINSANNIVESE